MSTRILIQYVCSNMYVCVYVCILGALSAQSLTSPWKKAICSPTWIWKTSNLTLISILALLCDTTYVCMCMYVYVLSDVTGYASYITWILIILCYLSISYKYIWIYIYVCLMYVYIHACMYVCMYVYTCMYVLSCRVRWMNTPCVKNTDHNLLLAHIVSLYIYLLM